MKVTGPGSGPGALPSDLGEAQGALKTGEKAGIERPQGGPPTSSERLASGSGVAQTEAAATPAPGVVGTHDIAAALRAGALPPAAAMDQLIERIVNQQLSAAAPTALRDSLRETLRDALETDPMLAAKLREIARDS
ncbi:MAG TPA: hypothetical protein VH374_11360 [Polyangia bacterium]|jgi:hypothetical protein|nr:hypothetical protein [Polyangia bacterium]